MIKRFFKKIDQVFRFILMKFVWIYRTFLSGIFRQFGGKCRFYPSCSEYAMEALKVHGGVKGGWLTVKRFFKCGPFHEGGVDLVPPEKCTHNVKINKEFKG